MTGAHTGSAIRTLVIGGGGAGAPLAARLAQDPRRRVTLIEAGSADPETPRELLDAGALPAAAPTHPANWAYPAALRPEQPSVVARGRILGGSTTINGGYFVRATRADFERWAEVGGAAWSFDAALPLLRGLEHDHDFGGPLHGTEGPMPVARPPQSNPVSVAFTEAAHELGFPAESDKNGDCEAGVGAVPSNILNGVRVNTAAAFLTRTREHMRILGGTRAHRILLAPGDGPGARPRAVGVDTSSGIIEADEVVLAAGSIATPQILMLSGVGPREHLEELGIPVVADLPVGVDFADHPNLSVVWRTAKPVVEWDAGYGFPTALNFDAARIDEALASRPEGDVEILLASKPLEYLVGGIRPETETLEFLVALQEHTGRGVLTLRSADPTEPPRIEYRYLELEEDRRRMRAGVRTAARILRTAAFHGLFAGFAGAPDAAGSRPADRELGDRGLDDEVLDDDDALDAWIGSRLGTALHTCATAAMGRVVDGQGRVLGVDGLRVADTSILPTAPHRGPSNTAVFIGERIARSMLGDSEG